MIANTTNMLAIQLSHAGIQVHAKQSHEPHTWLGLVHAKHTNAMWYVGDHASRSNYFYFFLNQTLFVWFMMIKSVVMIQDYSVNIASSTSLTLDRASASSISKFLFYNSKKFFVAFSLSWRFLSSLFSLSTSFWRLLNLSMYLAMWLAGHHALHQSNLRRIYATTYFEWLWGLSTFDNPWSTSYNGLR